MHTLGHSIRGIVRRHLLASSALIALLLAASCGANGYGVRPTSPTAGTARREVIVHLGYSMASISVGTAPGMASTTAAAVQINNFSFGPATMTVPAGTTVTWANQDSITHTVTADDRSFDSSQLKPGDQFSYTFTTPGTYSYHCSIHPFMTATVVVQ